MDNATLLGAHAHALLTVVASVLPLVVFPEERHTGTSNVCSEKRRTGTSDVCTDNVCIVLVDKAICMLQHLSTGPACQTMHVSLQCYAPHLALNCQHNPTTHMRVCNFNTIQATAPLWY